MATTVPAIDPQIEADAASEADDDSAYGAEIASYTESLSSDVEDYKFENGRRYHAYREGAYVYPNDEDEKDRLGIMHKLFEVRLEGKLHMAPIGEDPQRILDIGTGTGIWAMDIGDKYPSAQILGNDLSPIQPRWVPPNVHFEVDDVESDWQHSRDFDFIHCRCMAPAIRDWPRLIRQCYEHLKPGGWVEYLDLDVTWTSPDDSLKETSSMLQASLKFIDGSRKAGMEPCPGPKLEGWVKDAGFTEVVHEKMVMPIGTWPADKLLKHVGAWNHLQYTEGLGAFMMAIFTRVLGWTYEEVQVFMAMIKTESKDPRIHSMYHLHVVYGKKPE